MDGLRKEFNEKYFSIYKKAAKRVYKYRDLLSEDNLMMKKSFSFEGKTFTDDKESRILRAIWYTAAILVSSITQFFLTNNVLICLFFCTLSILITYILEHIIEKIIWYYIPLYKYRRKIKETKKLEEKAKDLVFDNNYDMELSEEIPMIDINKSMREINEKLDLYLFALNQYNVKSNILRTLNRLINVVKSYGDNVYKKNASTQRLTKYVNIYIKEITNLIIQNSESGNDTYENQIMNLIEKVYELLKEDMDELDKGNEIGINSTIEALNNLIERDKRNGGLY